MESNYVFPLIGVLASLLGAYISFRYFLYYRGRIYTGEGDQDYNRRLFRMAQVFLLVSSLAYIALLVNLFNLSRTALSPPATVTPAPGEGAGTLSPAVSPSSPRAPTPSPLSSLTPTVIPGVGFARIGNTNGFGVNVRAGPGLQSELLTQLSDGNRVELTGEEQAADGFTWQHIRLDDGRLGWIANIFLIPEP